MKKSTWGTEIDFFFVLKPEVLRITSVSYNVLLLGTFGVLQSTEIKTPEYVFLVLKNSTLTSPREHEVSACGCIEVVLTAGPTTD